MKFVKGVLKIRYGMSDTDDLLSECRRLMNLVMHRYDLKV